VLTASPATRVFLAAGATDMRKSFDTLGALVRSELGGDLVSGHLFVFCNGRRDRIKVVFFDGSGLWVCAKRLEKGTFWWPDSSHRGAVEMTSAEFSALIGGLDLQGMGRRRWYRVRQMGNDTHAH
jgi:transposase